MYPLSLSNHLTLKLRYAVALHSFTPSLPTIPSIRQLFEIRFTHSSFLQYIGLQILEKLITTKWKTLPEAQRHGTSPFICYLYFFWRVHLAAALIVSGVGRDSDFVGGG